MDQSVYLYTILQCIISLPIILYDHCCHVCYRVVIAWFSDNTVIS